MQVPAARKTALVEHLILPLRQRWQTGTLGEHAAAARSASCLPVRLSMQPA